MAVDEYGMREAYTQMMINSPHQALWMVFRTIIEIPFEYIRTAFGESLEWFTLETYEPYIILMFGLFTLLLFERNGRANRSLKIFSIFSSLIMVLLIFLSELLIWTEEGSKFITGVQGRYFLPFLLLVPLMLSPSDKKIHPNKLVTLPYLYMILSLVNISAIVIIFSSHI